ERDARHNRQRRRRDRRRLRARRVGGDRRGARRRALARAQALASAHARRQVTPSLERSSLVLAAVLLLVLARPRNLPIRLSTALAFTEVQAIDYLFAVDFL